MTTTTRQDYNARFSDLSDAMAFEDSVLDSDEGLPVCALAVKADNSVDPPAEYWDFLIDQLNQVERETAASVLEDE